MRDMTPLKFGIDNILSPEFGVSVAPSTISPISFLAHSPSSIPASPSSISPTFPTNLSTDSRGILPAWVFCTRYSDRPSAGSGSRNRKSRKRESTGSSGSEEEKRPRTAFTPDQLDRLKQQFLDSPYLDEKRRQQLAHELRLNESQIKIWFQNKRAKLKKANGERSGSGGSQMAYQMMLSQAQSAIIRP